MSTYDIWRGIWAGKFRPFRHIPAPPPPPSVEPERTDMPSRREELISAQMQDMSPRLYEEILRNTRSRPSEMPMSEAPKPVEPHDPLYLKTLLDGLHTSGPERALEMLKRRFDTTAPKQALTSAMPGVAPVAANSALPLGLYSRPGRIIGVDGPPVRYPLQERNIAFYDMGIPTEPPPVILGPPTT